MESGTYVESGTGTILTRAWKAGQSVESGTVDKRAWKAGQRAGKRDRYDIERAGKRDRYDIDKMGSFGLCFGDATDSEGRSWWNGFSRLESRRGAMQLFEKAADYQAFEQVLRDTLDQSPMRICAYAVMPNHWHLLLWPECDGELAAFMQRLTITHVRRWQEHRGYAGLGHVYQGRYKSFPVESEEHFWVVARYVECDRVARQSRLASGEMAVVKLVATLSSYGRRAVAVGGVADRYASELARAGQSNRQRAGTGSLRRSVQRGRPFGQPEWQKEIGNVWA